MAIINAIAMGKAHGKLGNVVFQCYNKKTIARQRNYTRTNPPTPAQLIAQQKLATTAMAWNFCSGFWDNIIRSCNKVGTRYNWFVLNFNYAASHAIYDDNRLAFNSFSNRIYLRNIGIDLYFVKTENEVPHSDEVHIMFRNLGIFINDNIILNCLIWDEVNQETIIYNRELSYEEIEAGEAYFMPSPDSNTMPMVYLSDSSKYLISNVNFNVHPF